MLKKLHALGFVRTGVTSATVSVPEPYLGTPTVNLNQTTLSESGGVFTHISHLIVNDPNDARTALHLAERKIGAAAANSQLLQVGQAKTRTALTKLLEELGFTHVAVDWI